MLLTSNIFVYYCLVEMIKNPWQWHHFVGGKNVCPSQYNVVATKVTKSDLILIISKRIFVNSKLTGISVLVIRSIVKHKHDMGCAQFLEFL